MGNIFLRKNIKKIDCPKKISNINSTNISSRDFTNGHVMTPPRDARDPANPAKKNLYVFHEEKKNLTIPMEADFNV